MKPMQLINAAVRRMEGAAWVVLVTLALIVPWFGIEPPMTGDVGGGMLTMDIAVTLLLILATVSQIVRIALAEPTEHLTTRIASWLLLVTLSLMSARMGWLLFAFGDIHMTTTMGLALACLGASVVLHAAGRVIYGGHG